MLSVLPIIPYPSFISIILNLLIPKPSPISYIYITFLNFSASAHGYIVADKFV